MIRSGREIGLDGSGAAEWAVWLLARANSGGIRNWTCSALELDHSGRASPVIGPGLPVVLSETSSPVLRENATLSRGKGRKVAEVHPFEPCLVLLPLLMK